MSETEGITEVKQHEAPDAPSEGGRPLAVSEARRYRKRAQAAEQTVTQLQQQLAEQGDALKVKDELIDSLERRSQIDAMLIAEEAMDVGAARLLTEAAIAEMDDADVAEAVTELRRMHPYLFRQRACKAVSQAAEIDSRSRAAATGLEHAAQQAHESGSRRDLLRYLRLRRKQ